ncbi:MAG: peptidyl-prolyl cis-trans isomerase [Desulfovibrionaceae bacterium]|nr:peptidyl-prolyl cis-trans isomerase [Desulfovibrionaceae bacterium]MBR5734506.1 peptidyl-prolyl cis-trans isomerase [Desulfovibrionaceae bacterium]
MVRKMFMVLAMLMLCCAAAYAEDFQRVKVETSLGNFVAELYMKKAPKTVRNFLVYARSGFYDGTIFHRVIPGFVIQGGGFDEAMNQKPTRSPIENEAGNGLKNLQYTLSMARTSDPDSATSQFFINLKDNSSLDYRASNAAGYGYAVFGKVVQGMDVVDRIGSVPTGRKGMFSDVPTWPVIIKRITLLQ